MPTSGIDFATLTLKDALDLAVQIEEEARDRYAEFAEQMTQFHTPAAAHFFAKMARVEELHRSQLAQRRREQFGDAPVTMSRAMIYDVEAPEYDEARAFMTLRQALGAALHAEVKAHEFFAQFAGQVKDPSVRALFEELAKEELEHQGLVKNELVKAPPEDAVQGDQSDEPVAQ
jgi:rubrerythrin